MGSSRVVPWVKAKMTEMFRLPARFFVKSIAFLQTKITGVAFFMRGEPSGIGRRRAFLAIVALPIICAFAAFVVWKIDATGIFHRVDLWMYDYTRRIASSGALGTNTRVVLVTFDSADAKEEEKNYHSSVLTDEHLAELLRKLAKAQATAIGVDIFRGEPIPKDSHALTDFVREGSKYPIVFSWQASNSDADEDMDILPPQAMRSDSETLAACMANHQLGFCDMPSSTLDRVTRTICLEMAANNQQDTIRDAARMANSGMVRSFACELASKALKINDVPGAVRDRYGWPIVDGNLSKLETTEGFQIPMDYSGGPASSFVSKTVRDLDRGVDGSFCAGKVVILANLQEGKDEKFKTPLGTEKNLIDNFGDDRELGCILHCRATDQLLRICDDKNGGLRRPVVWRATAWTWLAAAIGGALAGLLGAWLAPDMSGILGSVAFAIICAVVLGLVLFCLRCFFLGWALFIPQTSLLASVEASALSSYCGSILLGLRGLRGSRSPVPAQSGSRSQKLDDSDGGRIEKPATDGDRYLSQPAPAREVKRDLIALQPKVENWVTNYALRYGLCPPDWVIRKRFDIPRGSFNKMWKRSKVLRLWREDRQKQEVKQGRRNVTSSRFSIEQFEASECTAIDEAARAEAAEKVARLSRAQVEEQLLNYCKDPGKRVELKAKFAAAGEEELNETLISVWSSPQKYISHP
jgi:CHASE2 domain-containing sensor protein